MRKWHSHFTRAPLAPVTALAQVKCREHAQPCQTRAISRSENKSKRSVLEIYARSHRFKDVRMRHAQVAFTLYTLPPRSSYSPGAGKVQGACAAMAIPNSLKLYDLAYVSNRPFRLLFSVRLMTRVWHGCACSLHFTCARAVTGARGRV